MITALTRSLESATMERFQRDPYLAAGYLAAILIDGNESEIVQTERIEKAYSGGSY
jgi:hypothetical protein